VRRVPEQPAPSWWARRWRRIEKPIALLVEDTAKFLSAILALALGYGLLRCLAAMGYPVEWIAFLEVVHYYGLAVVICMFVVDLVLKVAAALFSEPE